MLPNTKADVAKPVSSTSASLNPYAVDPTDPVDDGRIRSWLATIDREMGQHRSPFVAAEVILRHLDEYAAQMTHPDQIYLATTLAVLRRCVPQLSPEFRDIATAAIHEIIPAISFTHAQPLADMPTSSSVGTASSTESMARASYSECFLRVFRLYRVHASQLTMLSQRDDAKEHLMDRVVAQLDDLWVKMCFLTWRVHCKKIRDKKVFFRRLVKRGIEGRFIHVYVRNWRAYAHKTVQAARLSHVTAASKELDRLYPVEQEAKNLHQRATEEMREKMRLLEESNQRCNETRLRLDSLKALLLATQQSLRDHWLTWQVCVKAIFTDPRSLPRMSDDVDTAISAFEQNITDTASQYSQRARARTNKLSLRHVQQFLEFTQDLVAPPPQAGMSTALSPRLARQVSGTWSAETPSSQVVAAGARLSQRLLSNSVPQTPSVPLILAALTSACRPVVSPYHAMDYLHADQSKLSLALSFLSYAWSGGHCSLFARPMMNLLDLTRVRDDRSEPRKDENHDETGGAGGDTLAGSEVPPTVPASASGTRMVEDVTDGLDQLHDSTQYNDRYLLAVRRALSTSEMDLVRDCVGRLFERWSVVGLPLDRRRVEAATQNLVAPVDRPVVTALYPARGIHTLTELLNYLTSVSEYSGTSLVNVADRLEFDYKFEPDEVLALQLHSATVASFTREHSAALTRLWNHLRAENSMDVSFERTKAFFSERLFLETEEVDDIWACVASAEPGTVAKVGKEDFEKLLLVAGEYVCPSPFVPAAQKLAVVVDGWLAAELDGEH